MLGTGAGLGATPVETTRGSCERAVHTAVFGPQDRGGDGCSVASGEVVGDGVGRVPVERVPRAVVTSGGLRIGVAGEVLHVT
jgi:hypothetical protein